VFSKTVRRLHCAFAVIAALGALGGFFAGEVARAATYPFVRTVMHFDAAVPGFDSDYRWSTINAPVINDAGQVAFSGDARPQLTPQLPTSAVWAERAGQGLQIVAREFAQAPGTPAGTVFNGLNLRPFQFNNAGEVGFMRGVSGAGVDGSNDAGIWLERGPGNLQLALRELDAAPGTPTDVKFGILSPPVVNDACEMSVVAYLVGPGVTDFNRFGIWTDAGDAGNLRLLVRDGQQVPGLPSGVRFLSVSNPFLNSAGENLFLTGLFGPGINSTNEVGLWSSTSSGVLRLVAREGDQPPSLPAGAQFGFMSPDVLRFNDAGQSAFHSRLQGAAVDNSNDESLWMEVADNQLHLVAREGQLAPEIPGGVIFGSLTPLSLNQGGRLFFNGQLAGPGVDHTNQYANYLYDATTGSYDLIVRHQDPAPGMGDGWSIRQVNYMALNDNNDVVVYAQASDGVGIVDGLWSWKPGGDLQLLLRQDDLIDVDNGPGSDLRSLWFLRTLYNAEGYPGSFNHRGELAVEMRFNDGTGGVFVITIPEPSTVAMCAIAIVALLRSTRRSNRRSMWLA